MKIDKLLLLMAFILGIFSPAQTTEEYAEKTGKGCKYCHLDSSGGGELTQAGREYLTQLSKDTDPGGAEGISKRIKGFSHAIRLAAGFLHIFMAFFWFGTILYVHIILKPAYAAHGLPRGEVRLGLASMLIMAITGSILTLYRVPTWSFLLETRFGILLLIKILLFLVMVCLALIAVIFIGPKLKARVAKHRSEAENKFTEDELLTFSGEPEGSIYFAYEGKVYDASLSGFWKDGTHFARHKAGEDLTTMLSQAPHGEEKILDLPVVGELIHAKLEKKGFEKMFFFLAYAELVFVILIILILALWKWW